MAVPPARVQSLLFRETLGLLATYSWQGSVTLDPAEFGQSDVDLTLPEFFREFRLRHAVATARQLPDILESIESRSSNSSRLERAESRGVIRGRLDSPRYLARKAVIRSLPRRYPIVRSRIAYDTPENLLAAEALREVRTAMRDNPFSSRSAEGVEASRYLRWSSSRLLHRPWDELPPHAAVERLYHETDTRVRRRQTGNDRAYLELIRWYDQWRLDLHRLGTDQRDEVVQGLLAFPGGDAFWDKVFEVWCLLFVAAALDALGWTKLEGPRALHESSGVVYRYLSPSQLEADVRFQRKEPLPAGRWSYRDGKPLRGIPDITISSSDGRFPLLIDAKNRYVNAGRVSRSEETYKMLGYSENFLYGQNHFRGVLIFPSAESGQAIMDGPRDGRLDLITVDLPGDKSRALAAIEDAVARWAAG